MPEIKNIQWIDPLKMAESVNKNHEKWVFLYSGLDVEYSGKYSILAFNFNREIKSNDFDHISGELTNNKGKFENSWFGYLGYGLKNALENLTKDAASYIDMPKLWMMQFSTIIVFDHNNKSIQVWGDCDIPDIDLSENKYDFQVDSLSSNMSKEQYLDRVSMVKEAISRGDLCQANLTRKFFGKFDKKPDGYGIFLKLVAASPAPYSAFLKMDDYSIISSSPERFINITEDGYANTMPIKGSAGRGKNQAEDQIIKDELLNSQKDRAENLMIVDLSRNDLARGCEIGSVKVDGLFQIHSYSTIHHMISSVCAQKRKDVSSLDLVKYCFPPGSMTGTPKIRAMQLCSELENYDRGIYSGAIGYFAGDGSVDLSVVIRTLILQGNKFEFQVGGAVVSDSTPLGEWQETLVKARGILKALEVDEQSLADL
ncbi:anthranilate synthase component I family protein [Rickettsiales bacterium]|nr:anthranilate synthase component I family protein [Rickettsiales bacterium]